MPAIISSLPPCVRAVDDCAAVMTPADCGDEQKLNCVWPGYWPEKPVRRYAIYFADGRAVYVLVKDADGNKATAALRVGTKGAARRRARECGGYFREERYPK